MEVKKSPQEIIDKMQELFDKMWLSRHLGFVASGVVTKTEHPKAFEAEEKLRNKYGWQNYVGETDFEWGQINGARQALEWLFGEDWDGSLDT